MLKILIYDLFGIQKRISIYMYFLVRGGQEIGRRTSYVGGQNIGKFTVIYLIH